MAYKDFSSFKGKKRERNSYGNDPHPPKDKK